MLATGSKPFKNNYCGLFCQRLLQICDLHLRVQLHKLHYNNSNFNRITFNNIDMKK